MKELCQACAKATNAERRTGFVLLGRCELCGQQAELAVVKPRPTKQMTLEAA